MDENTENVEGDVGDRRKSSQNKERTSGDAQGARPTLSVKINTPVSPGSSSRRSSLSLGTVAPSGDTITVGPQPSSTLSHFWKPKSKMSRNSTVDEEESIDYEGYKSLIWPETEYEVEIQEEEMQFKPFKGTSKFLSEKRKYYGSPISPRTEYEGDLLEDYMQFIIEPIVEPRTPFSTISTDLSCMEQELQRTIAIIKPGGMPYKDVILRAINEAGFQIIGKRHLHLTAEQVSEIYAKYYGSPSFPHLVLSASVEPVLAISMAASGAVSKWKRMVGPDGSLKAHWFYPLSVRKRFGLLNTRPDVLHASETTKESNRENRYFYPNNILEPVLQERYKVEDFLNLYVTPTLTLGLVQVAKAKPLDPIMFLADWLLLNNPYQPRMPYHIAATPT